MKIKMMHRVENRLRMEMARSGMRCRDISEDRWHRRGLCVYAHKYPAVHTIRKASRIKTGQDMRPQRSIPREPSADMSGTTLWRIGIRPAMSLTALAAIGRHSWQASWQRHSGSYPQRAHIFGGQLCRTFYESISAKRL